MAEAVDPLLTIPEAAEALSAEMGRTYTFHQLRHAANDKKLPFFKDPITGERMIRKSHLFRAWHAQQSESSRQLAALERRAQS